MSTQSTDPIWFRMTDAAAMLGLSRSMLYELAQRGELPVVRVGRTMRVPATALREWASRLENEQVGTNIDGSN